LEGSLIEYKSEINNYKLKYDKLFEENTELLNKNEILKKFNEE
jgi:hypothetical protein